MVTPRHISIVKGSQFIFSLWQCRKVTSHSDFGLLAKQIEPILGAGAQPISAIFFVYKRENGDGDAEPVSRSEVQGVADDRDVGRDFQTRLITTLNRILLLSEYSVEC